MACTAEEIAAKRKAALERLHSKDVTAQPLHTSTSFYGESNGTPANQQNVAAHSATNQKKFKPNSVISPKQSENTSVHSKSKEIPSTEQPLAPVFIKKVTCRLHLVSSQKFTATFTGFSERLVDIFKTIPSKSFDLTSKQWSFLLTDYDQLYTKLCESSSNIITEGIPCYVRKIVSQKIAEPDWSWESSVEPFLLNQLMPFQKEGVRFGIEKDGRCLIADEMGLGKTYQALAIADYYKDHWPLLIVTTATTRDVWISKIRSLLPSVPCDSIVCLSSGQDFCDNARVVVVSHNMMERQQDRLVEKKFGVLILDESHNLKSRKAKCTLAAKKLAAKAQRVILLSGTPALSRPCELFTQLQLLDKKFMKFLEYSTRYCDGKSTAYGWDATGQSNFHELNVLLAHRFMIRRVKAEVLTELTEKTRETIDLDPNLIWIEKESKTNMVQMTNRMMTSTGRSRELMLWSFYNETARVKAKAVCAHLMQLVKEKKKFIVFAHHKCMMNAINECFVDNRINFMRIDGKTATKSRNARIQNFQNKDSCQVALLSLKACNTGITLTAAQMVVFAELDWNPSTLTQAESRAHRIGQTEMVRVQYLLAKGTADDIIWNMLQSKQVVLAKAGLCNDNFSEAAHTVVTSPAKTPDGNIRKYLNISASDNDTGDYRDLLNDSEDEDFLDINY